MQHYRQLQAWGRHRLAAAGVEQAALDARLLLQHVAGFDAALLIASEGEEATNDVAAKYKSLIERRAIGEPVSKILGVREFFGRAYAVSEAVLDPRPDSEVLVEGCLSLPGRDPKRVLDLGTGSGCLLITLLAERPTWRGVGVDLSPQALAIAKANALEHLGEGHVEFLVSDWFAAVSGRFDLIISNPPYIESGAIAGLAPEVRNHDPLLALDGGADGLACYRAIASGAGSWLQPGGHVAVEIGIGQSEPVIWLFSTSGFKLLESRPDLAGRTRVLIFTTGG